MVEDVLGKKKKKEADDARDRAAQRAIAKTQAQAEPSCLARMLG